MVEMNAAESGIVGDIGGTNARFALVGPDGSITHVRVFAPEDYPTLGDAIAVYLKRTSARVTQGVLAIASPVTGDRVALTNYPWAFSIEGLRENLGFKRLRVINDFVANALAVPYLESDDRIQIGAGSPVTDATIGVIGPGTGLGVSALIQGSGGGTPIEGEGGHVTMSPADAHESAVLDLMRKRYDHVSAERVLSGQGLVNLYNAICELGGVPAAPFTAAQITDAGIQEQDPHAGQATAMFCAMLGTVAGNLALILGARGGVYIAGGIVPRLGAAFAQSQFRARFEAKGRLRDYLMAIPTYVIVRQFPALLGAAKLLHRS
jgi:glucokinase